MNQERMEQLERPIDSSQSSISSTQAVLQAAAAKASTGDCGREHPGRKSCRILPPSSIRS